MKIVITGGLGFIGSHITEKLVSEGHSVSVISLKNEIPPVLSSTKGIIVHQGDYGDRFLLKNVISKADIVIHAACTTVPENSTLNPVFDIQTNVIPTLQLLESCREEKVKKIIFLSSGGVVYGQAKNIPITENEAISPISSYGISKATIENYFRLYTHLYGIDHCILRIANAYGPGQLQARNQGVIGAWLYKIKNDLPVEIWGDGQIVRDYIFVSDIARAVSIAIEKNITGTCNLGTGRGVSLNELITIINTILHKNIQPVYREKRGFDVPANILNASKFNSLSGWKPGISLEEGIKITFASQKPTSV